jgi:hypothetical protein
LPEQMLKREVAFVLRRHGDAREVMWLRAYGLHVLERFGFLLRFALRVPQDSTMPDRRRLELSLTHKNGRLNEDFYLDQNQKIEMFLSHYFHDIARLVLHDGTIVELDAKWSVSNVQFERPSCIRIHCGGSRKITVPISCIKRWRIFDLPGNGDIIWHVNWSAERFWNRGTRIY